MALSHNPRLVTDGLVLCLDAANPKSYPGSGTTWFDLSGNGNDGTLVNGVTKIPDNKGIMSFDGIDDYITLGNFDWFTPPQLTIEIFSKRKNDGGAEYSCEIAKDGSFYFRLDKTSVEFRTWTDVSGDSGNDSFGGFDFEKWYYMVATYDGSVKKVYLDSIKRSQEYSVEGNISSGNGQPLLIGGRNSAGSYIIDADIGLVILRDIALTESEIKQNFNALRGRYGL